MRRLIHLIAGILSILMLLTALPGIAWAEQEAADPEKKEDPAESSGTEARQYSPIWDIQGDILVRCTSLEAEVRVPDGVREIKENAFLGLLTLETVILPASVEVIGKNAFAECRNLQKVSLSAGSRLKEIKSKAFLNCVLLNKRFVPEGVKVADNAFLGVEGPQEEPQEPDGPTPPRGGGRSSGNTPHSRNTAPAGPDYDQIAVGDAEKNASGVMQQLTLGGEALDLALTQEGAESSGFTVSTMDWQKGESQPGGKADTLVLTAEREEAGHTDIWTLNGAVLRRMNRSGIDYLVLRSGDRIIAMETKGFLAGWAYDALKNEGTASRRFDYVIEMKEGYDAVWHLRVNGKEYTLTADRNSPIFLTGACDGPAVLLERPYEQTVFAAE